MKKITLIVAGCLCSIIALAQVKPFYTQYILNQYILNPAVTGIENYTDIKLSNRNQWTGINGAPVTNYFTIHTPIGKSDLRTSATSFEVPGENPRGKQLWEEYTPPEAHHGIGFTAMNDKAGYINRWSLSASYAYHKPLSVKTTLAAGFSAGISSVNLDRSKIEWANLDPNDPAIGISTGELKKTET
ncbi:MAG: PorP/SprF family type IX secretion system membrane protein [Ferruginibacter sp.]